MNVNHQSLQNILYLIYFIIKEEIFGRKWHCYLPSFISLNFSAWIILQVSTQYQNNIFFFYSTTFAFSRCIMDEKIDLPKQIHSFFVYLWYWCAFSCWCISFFQGLRRFVLIIFGDINSIFATRLHKLFNEITKKLDKCSHHKILKFKQALYVTSFIHHAVKTQIGWQLFWKR